LRKGSVEPEGVPFWDALLLGLLVLATSAVASAIIFYITEV